MLKYDPAGEPSMRKLIALNIKRDLIYRTFSSQVFFPTTTKKMK